jgi:glycosyltransferase involved in cell wall biosynthesis
VVRQLASTEVSVLMAQPEWHWGVPNVIIEALAASHAVVTTRFGSVEELIRDGETGLIVPPRDPQALADALERLATDPTLRRRLADAGHERVCREYDLRRTTEEYLRLFSEAHEPVTREAVPLQESP